MIQSQDMVIEIYGRKLLTYCENYLIHQDYLDYFTKEELHHIPLEPALEQNYSVENEIRLILLVNNLITLQRAYTHILCLPRATCAFWCPRGYV